MRKEIKRTKSGLRAQIGEGSSVGATEGVVFGRASSKREARDSIVRRSRNTFKGDVRIATITLLSEVETASENAVLR